MHAALVEPRRDLLAFMADHPEATAVGPRLIYANGNIQKSFTRLPTLRGELCYNLVFHFFPFGQPIKALLGWDRIDLGSLTEPREAEVLRLLVLGHAVNAVAERLGISPHTVRDHVKNLYRKTGSSSRNELLRRVAADTASAPLSR